MAGKTEKVIWKSVTVGDVVTGISVAAAVAEYFADRNKNRKITGLLKDIKNHLNIITSKIDFITEQNIEILHRLDELPIKIRAIVAQEFSIGWNVSTLNQRYSDTINIQNNYLQLPENEHLRYRIHTHEWDRLMENLTYLFNFENRVSYIPMLIQICELAQVVSEKKGTTVVKNLVEDKYERVLKLLSDYDNLYNNQLTDLEKLMRSYVMKYKIKASLNGFVFSYSLIPKEPEKKTFLYYGPALTGDDWDGEPIEVSEWIHENIASNKDMMKHQSKISSTHDEFNHTHRTMIELVTMKVLLETYIETLNEDLNSINNDKIELNEDLSIKSNNELFIGYEESLPA